MKNRSARGDTEGFGSGSIPLTSGPGSGRPKIMWIWWIRNGGTIISKPPQSLKFSLFQNWEEPVRQWMLGPPAGPVSPPLWLAHSNVSLFSSTLSFLEDILWQELLHLVSEGRDCMGKISKYLFPISVLYWNRERKNDAEPHKEEYERHMIWWYTKSQTDHKIRYYADLMRKRQVYNVEFLDGILICICLSEHLLELWHSQVGVLKYLIGQSECWSLTRIHSI